jgi:hypothetical protein
MLRRFLGEYCAPHPTAKTTLRKLFDRFKAMPGSESWSRRRFANECLRAGVDVRKTNGTLVVHGLAVADEKQSNIPARPRVKQREREDKIESCGKCGGPIHPCYWTPPFWCEDCLATYWGEHKIPGARHRYWALQPN